MRVNNVILGIAVCCLVFQSCQPPNRVQEKEEVDATAPEMIDEEVIEHGDGKNLFLPASVEHPTIATDKKKPFVKCYIENSSSIDGYVNGSSDLRDFVEGYLYKVKNELNPSGIECFFINSNIIPLGSDIKKFVDRVTPQQFRKNGGKRGTSDIADILRRITPISGDTMALLVSDFIFSPGKQNADYYINRQYNQINDLFSQVAASNNMSVLIYRLEGKFDGTYYDRSDKPSRLVANRPFFLWAIGADEYIRGLRSLEDSPNIKIRNKCIVSHYTPYVKYAIRPNAGDYRVSRKSNHSIEKAKLSSGKGSHRGNQKMLTIGVNVDFSPLIVNEQYLLDTSNYEVDNPKYRVLSVATSSNPRYTHTLRIATTSNNAATVTISLKNKIPKWVYRFNDEVGDVPKGSEELQTTYGLKKLVMGVFDAFTSKNDNLCQIVINVNQ